VIVLVYGQDIEKSFYDNGILIQTIRNVYFKGFSWFLTKKKIERIINQLYLKGDIQLLEVPDWTGISSFINLSKCPIIIRLHGSDTYFCYLDKRRVKWKNKFHEKRSLRNANGHISVSKYTADLTNKVFEQEISYRIIPNGINIESFDISGIPLARKEILYFGTLIRKKGALELPFIFNEVVKKMPDARLILVGGDTYDIITGSNSTWELMRTQFSDAALGNVEYCGKVSYSRVKGFIESAGVCIFPSYAEAFPVSWLEAMAMSKPIVASNIGWACEMIEDGIEGYLRYPNEHIEFASAILDLMVNSERAKEFGVNARKKVESKFGSDRIAQANLTYYKEVVSKCSRTH
jgi:glycosyltransferase involved in cell wall biosynthesis